MKLADFLSDKSKQALNEVCKSYSKESLEKMDFEAEDNDDEQSQEKGKANRKVDRRIEWQAKKRKKAELRQRLREKEQAYILAKETAKIKHALEKSSPIGTRQIRKEVDLKEQNRNRVHKGNKIYPTSTTNSLKAWSIPMGGQNKRY